MVASGLSFTIYGVTIYYFLPLALCSFNLKMLSQIIIFIIVGLLFALTLMAYNIQATVEKVITHIFLFFEKSSMR